MSGEVETVMHERRFALNGQVYNIEEAAFSFDDVISYIEMPDGSVLWVENWYDEDPPEPLNWGFRKEDDEPLDENQVVYTAIFDVSASENLADVEELVAEA